MKDPRMRDMDPRMMDPRMRDMDPRMREMYGMEYDDEMEDMDPRERERHMRRMEKQRMMGGDRRDPRMGNDRRDPRMRGHPGMHGMMGGYGRMRMRSPKRPDKFPVPPEIPTLTKPTEEQFSKLNAANKGFTIKWDTIEKLFLDYQK